MISRKRDFLIYTGLQLDSQKEGSPSLVPQLLQFLGREQCMAKRLLGLSSSWTLMDVQVPFIVRGSRGIHFIGPSHILLDAPSWKTCSTTADQLLIPAFFHGSSRLKLLFISYTLAMLKFLFTMRKRETVMILPEKRVFWLQWISKNNCQCPSMKVILMLNCARSSTLLVAVRLAFDYPSVFFRKWTNIVSWKIYFRTNEQMYGYYMIHSIVLLPYCF